MNQIYSYLIGDLVLLGLWSILFFHRKDLRKPMFIISTILGISGIGLEWVYTIDWWHPLTITGTRLGIEDFLFGFTVAGISSVAYEEVFHKRIKEKKKKSRSREIKEDESLLLISITALGLFFGSFYLLHLNSFIASIIALVIPTGYIWIKRNDLIIPSLAAGTIMMMLSFLAFIIPETINPGWVASAWNLENLSGIIILFAPLEDLIWFFLAGAYMGPLYEFWREAKIIDEKK